MKTGVVIPAYNVGDRLGDVLSKTVRFIPRHQIYVVDDGSTDATAAVAQNQGVSLIRHGRNRGKGEALKSGFRAILTEGFECLVTLDGDGQHNPDHIPDFISCMEKTKCDVVVGVRGFRVGKMPLDRFCSNVLSSLITSVIAGTRIPDSQCGYRLIRTSVLDDLRLRSRYYEFETELLVKAIWAGFKVATCPIALAYNGHGSHIRRFQDTKRFCRLLVRLMKEGRVKRRSV